MSALPELTLSTTLVRSPNQVSGDLEGKVVLLSIENGEYYNMNEVGSRIWAIIENPITLAALIEQLLSEFDVERATCEREALVFLERLRQEKLLKIDGGSP